MKETASIYPPRSRRGHGEGACLRRSALWILLAALGLWGFLIGCGDPRTEPARSPTPGHLQQIDLWNQAASSGEKLRADFTVDRELADTESPALLTLVAYVEPVGHLIRYDDVVDSLSWLDDALARYETILFRYGEDLQTLGDIDSLWLLYPDSLVPAFDSTSCDTHATICGDTIYCDSLNWAQYPDSMVLAFDTVGLGDCRAWINGRLQLYNDSTTWATAVQYRMMAEEDSLAYILDNEYTLAVWMDDDTTTRYPDAVYMDEDLTLGGQAIYAVPPDSATGLKACGFRLDMRQFQSCDPLNIHETLEVNWVTCFPGSTRPCLSPGPHTLWVRLNGAHTQITGTLVLIYAEEGS